MKKIILLGDSIRQIGYGPRVAEVLTRDYGCTVWQPDDNCRFASYTLRMCFDYKAQMGNADVIHWNNGLWDLCDLFGDGAFTPMVDYVNTMVRIARILKTYAPVVIFATTTPPSPKMWGHDMDRLKAYNQAVTQALTAEGILINDLFTPVYEDIDRMICDDLIHLSHQGIEVCAAQVIKAITAQFK